MLRRIIKARKGILFTIPGIIIFIAGISLYVLLGSNDLSYKISALALILSGFLFLFTGYREFLKYVFDDKPPGGSDSNKG